MTLAAPDYVEGITADRLGPVLDRMARLARDHVGWVNFEPAVLDEDIPPDKSGIFSLFSGRGPEVPLATWTPGEARRNRTEPPTIGILHGSGPRARARLEEAGCPVPEGWVVMQDSPKKGLVVAVPPAVGNGEVVAWLLGAATALSRVPLTGRWRAAFYEP